VISSWIMYFMGLFNIFLIFICYSVNEIKRRMLFAKLDLMNVHDIFLNFRVICYCFVCCSRNINQ